MTRITIGRSASNDIVYSDKTVSGNHLEITVENIGEYILEDKESTNGTYIDDMRIVRKDWDGSGELRLGNYIVDTKQLKEVLDKTHKKKKVDYSVEFASLLKAFEQYQSKKDAITKAPRLSMFIRILVTVGIVIVLLAFPEMIPPHLRYPIISLSSVLALMANFMNPSIAKRNKKLDLLRLEYEERLVCPKCNYSMIGHSIHYWKGREDCRNPKCDAIYQK